VFTVLTLSRLAAWGQSGEIPGRDLLTFPVGLMAEAPALGTIAGTGLWNPATALLPDGFHWRLSAAAMNASSNILGTETDPQSIGNPVPYGTTVISLVAARRLTPNLSVGQPIRERSGSLDDVSRGGVSVDAGVIAEHLTRFDVRIGASSFLLSPGAAASERASWLFGADARVAGPGIVLHSAGYNIGVAREDGVNGFAPTYQFSLSSLLK
jgi:hypothetical protein